MSTYPPNNIQMLTFPGCTVPTEGETVIGAPFGTTNSNDVGPTGAISPKIKGHT